MFIKLNKLLQLKVSRCFA